jgi:DNA recombination-dependent growth factor C
MYYPVRSVKLSQPVVCLKQMLNLAGPQIMYYVLNNDSELSRMQFEDELNMQSDQSE